MEENKAMYQEEILHLYQHPKNFGQLAGRTHRFRGLNASCGDDITFDLRIEHSKILDVTFHGKGCALCIASASLLSDVVKGKDVKEVEKMDTSFILGLLQISINPARLKCALLPLESVKGALTHAAR